MRARRVVLHQHIPLPVVAAAGGHVHAHVAVAAGGQDDREAVDVIRRRAPGAVGVEAGERQLGRLDRLRVTVNVPVYNEDPVLLDRALYALFTQTRLPNRVEVVASLISETEYEKGWFGLQSFEC